MKQISKLQLQSVEYNLLSAPEVSAVTETTCSIKPNVWHVWSSPISSLNITLVSPTNTSVTNEYFMEFDTADSGCSITFNSSIQWSGVVPEGGYHYQVSILNNIAVCLKSAKN